MINGIFLVFCIVEWFFPFSKLLINIFFVIFFKRILDLKLIIRLIYNKSKNVYGRYNKIKKVMSKPFFINSICAPTIHIFLRFINLRLCQGN